jgi:hypothetical protein
MFGGIVCVCVCVCDSYTSLISPWYTMLSLRSDVPFVFVVPKRAQGQGKAEERRPQERLCVGPRERKIECDLFTVVLANAMNIPGRGG